MITWQASDLAFASATALLIQDIYNGEDLTKWASDFSSILGAITTKVGVVAAYLPGNQGIAEQMGKIGFVLTGIGLGSQPLSDAITNIRTALTNNVIDASNTVVDAYNSAKDSLLDTLDAVVDVIDNVGTAAFDASVQAAIDTFDVVETALADFYVSTGAIAESITISVIDNTVSIIIDSTAEVVAFFTTSSEAISDAISQAYWDFLDAVAQALLTDPLIIDVNGDGLALDSFATSNALFDLDGDGIKENTGWTRAGSDDSFLVIDKNGDGQINDISEMFGGAGVAGFTELKQYDSNNDNLINSNDSQFGLLKLWNDADADGTVDAGELTTLAANNITEISLNKYSSLSNIEGNLQTAISTVTINRISRNIHELSFAFDDVNNFSDNPDLNLPAGFTLSIESILMPYSRGYGGVYSWQAAMSLDSTLLAMAQDLVATLPVDFYLINDKFEDFLFRWAGVENATAASVYASGTTNFDPRKMAFMEQITGEDFVNISSASINLAAKAWDVFFNEFLGRFMVQGNMSAAFPNASVIPALVAGSGEAIHGRKPVNDNFIIQLKMVA